MFVRTERTNRWIDSTERWTNEWKDRIFLEVWTDGRTDERIHGRTDGWRDEGAKLTDREMTDM